MPVVSYEVTAVVRDDLVARYETFMRERHLRDVLTTGCFTFAVLEASEPGKYRARYEAPSVESLERYLSAHAPRLRADALAHFPHGVALTREEWRSVQRIDP